MKIVYKTFATLITSLAVASFAIPTLAAGPLTPQSTQNGNIVFISGGVGEEEQEAIEAGAKNYNLEITNANKSGEYASGTDLIITGKSGEEMLHVNDTGPLFYAKLPAGKYEIKATNGMEVKVHDVTISPKKPSNVHLIWQQS